MGPMQRPFILLIVTVFLLLGCMGPTQLGYSPTQWQTLSPEEKQKSIANYHQIQRQFHPKTIYDGPVIAVTLASGEAMMPPFIKSYSFQTTSFQLNPGKCRSISLKAKYFAKKVPLLACYNGLTLSLDPSHYDLDKTHGTLRLTYHPLWDSGLTYSGLASEGYVRLKKVTVSIHSVRR